MPFQSVPPERSEVATQDSSQRETLGRAFHAAKTPTDGHVLNETGSGAQSEGRDTSGAQGYSPWQIILHWLIAALVLMQLIVNDAIRLAFGQKLNAELVELPFGAMLHIIGGVTILAMTLLRIVLRHQIGAPPPPKGGPMIFEVMGLLAHWGLYGLLLLMTLSGAAAWFWPSALAGTAHETLRLALIALILAHILGALVEHFLFGNRVIRRMLPKG